MTDTTYADHLLNQWGLWCLTGRTNLGYPRQTSFLNGQPTSGGKTLAITDETAMRVQRVVNMLDRDHRRAVDFYYVRMRNCDSATIASALRCGRATMYRRLDAAKVKLAQWMD